jgi:hypothetical protein
LIESGLANDDDDDDDDNNNNKCNVFPNLIASSQ